VRGNLPLPRATNLAEKEFHPSKKIAARHLSAFRGAESAREKDDKTYQQNQAKPAAADDATAKVKPAAAEQEKQNNHE
jgi:hypothetical protein